MSVCVWVFDLNNVKIYFMYHFICLSILISTHISEGVNGCLSHYVALC